MAANAGPILLDGGMGQEIVNRGGKGGYGEWAAAALLEHPGMVRQIHRDYIAAGADVITTNTYGTTRARLRHAGMEARLAELVRLAGQIAADARDEASADQVRIAASLPPLEASYVSAFELSFEETVAQFAELMDLLDPYVDILLAETLSTSFEVKAALAAARGRDKPLWIALTLGDHGSDLLRGGEALSDVLGCMADSPPAAILVNCCTPDSISRALPILRTSGLPFGGYANGFAEIPTTWEDRGGVSQLATRADLTPDAYAEEVAGWIEAGAAIVGGCCEVGPAHIARLRQVIDNEFEAENG